MQGPPVKDAIHLLYNDIRRQWDKMISKVNTGQDTPNLLSGILCPAPAPAALAGGVGVAMFMVVSCMLVPP